MIGYRYSAKCVNVVDGDTIDCEVDLGFHAYVKIRFRLSRINTPELNSPIEAVRARALEAKKFVELNVLNKTIEIVSFKTEKYGRFLAEVFYSETNLNDELLARGLADKYE